MLNNSHISVPVECRVADVITESVRVVLRWSRLAQLESREDGEANPKLVPEGVTDDRLLDCKRSR